MIEVHNKNKLIAEARTDLVLKYLAECYSNKPGNKTNRKEKFIEKYNRQYWQGLFKVLGEVKYQTLERWKKRYLDSKGDPYSLYPGYGLNFSSEKILGEVLIQIHLDTDKTELEDLQKEAIREIRAGRIKIFTLKEIN